VAAKIPVDVLPLRVQGTAGEFLKEVEQGEVERYQEEFLRRNIP